MQPKLVEVEIYERLEDDEDELMVVHCIEDMQRWGQAVLQLGLPEDVWPVMRV